MSAESATIGFACDERATVSSSGAGRRPTMNVRMPDSASSRAIACPMPVPAPVTIATRSCRSAMLSFLAGRHRQVAVQPDSLVGNALSEAGGRTHAAPPAVFRYGQAST